MLCLAFMFLASACIQAPQRTESTADRTSPTAPKRLVVAIAEEPTALIMTLIPQANVRARPVRLAVHQRIAIFDDRGALHPQLAAELPALETGTWVVRPDGTMRTSYRLHPNVTWHDGAPFTARDVVFGWKVTNDPDLLVNQRGVAEDIGSVETPDDHTFILEWNKTNPLGNAITEDGLGPLPAHLLEAGWLADKERFPNLNYWGPEFVGLGPYRLASWQPGSFMILQAYDAFYTGRAKIDTIEVRFIGSAPTLMANLLAGEVDGAIPPTLDFEQSMFVRDEWERAGKHPLVISQPVNVRIMAVQFRTPRPREILEARFRRGVLHALNRQVLIDGLLGGQSQIADTFIPPDDAKWGWVEDAVARYPYDPRRAAEQLAPLGWQRGAAGAFINAAGEPLTLSVRMGPQPDAERTLGIMGDILKREGITVEQGVNSPGEDRDLRIRSMFPSFYASDLAIGSEQVQFRYYGPNCPTEESRWGGANWGCYQNSAYDRVIDEVRSAIDPREQQQLYREWVRIFTDELPALPLFFGQDVTIFREGVTGVKGETRPRISSTWNVTEWDVR
jgi:peptide/nickel transport system substrate-binding protein